MEQIGETNFKDCDFDFLIRNIESKVLQECFFKILTFLDDDSLELEFSNTPNILDEILVRIVADVYILNTKGMYKKCKDLCGRIVKRVKTYSSGIYTLNCFYKQKAQNTIVADDRGGNNNNLHTRRTRSSTLESEDEEDPEPITDYFKSHSLIRILEFIKDKTQSCLLFSDLNIEKAEFIYEAFNSVATIDFNGSFVVRKICPALWEAAKVFCLKYEFSIRYMDSTTDKKYLLLEKEEKNCAGALTESLGANKHIKKRRHELSRVSPDFIFSSLKRVLDFYQDDSQASLIFSKVNVRDAKFLRTLLDNCRCPKIKSLYVKEIRELFDEILILDKKKCDFKVKIIEQNVGSEDKEFQFVKVPIYTIKHEIEQQIDQRSRARPPQPKLATPKMQSKKVCKSVKGKASVASRTDQLIEALSVPVKSDKALKMMLGMGWKGGALGSRGEGITEPIMPHLNSVAGAGLGHISKPKKVPKDQSNPIPTVNSRTSNEFRQLFLTELLDLIKSSDNSKTFRCVPKLKKKEKAFMQHAIKTFGARKRLTIMEDEQHLVDVISSMYDKDPDLLVSACVGHDKKQILLTKLHNTVKFNKKNMIQPEILDESLTENIQVMLDGLGSLCHSQKTIDNMKYRVEVLMQLLKFIKNNTENKIELKNVTKIINNKQKCFILRTVRDINKRIVFGATGPEVALSQAIKHNMGDFNLNVNCDHIPVSFYVTKEYIVSKTQTETINAESDNVFQFNFNINKKDFSKNENLYNEKDIKIVDVSNQFADNHQITVKNKFKEAVYKENIEVTNDNKVINCFDDNIEKYNKIIENAAKYGDGTVSEYNNGIAEVIRTKNSTKNVTKVTDYNDDNINNTEASNLQTIQSEIANAGFRGNTKNTMNSKAIINLANINKANVDVYNIDENIMTQNIPEVIDKNDNSNKLNDVIDKMSISDQTDYSVYGINDMSVSDGKLTDWDPNTSDNSDDSDIDLSLKNEAKVKNKQINKISEPKTDTKLVSLNKSFILGEDLLKYIQRIITINILQSEELPLLSCHGVHNGSLIYACHNKKSYDWLKEMCVANGINILSKEYDKMSFKIKWFYDKDDSYVFNMLGLYYKDIAIDNWIVVKKEILEDSILFVVKMDNGSFKFILDSDLTLYAGVDKIYFSIMFE